MKIGVFDSGVGGESFLQPIVRRFPDAEILYKTDAENLPYGNKTVGQLLELSIPIFVELEAEGCDAVVVACNTVSTNCIVELRRVVNMPLIAVEPMIEPAVKLSKSKKIAVCATPATLSSDRYKYLKQEFANDYLVIEPDCSDWASMIEKNQSNKIAINKVVDQLLDKDVDVIVLGCTHYHWIEHRIRSECAGKAVVIQPTDPVLIELEKQLRDRSPLQ